MDGLEVHRYVQRKNGDIGIACPPAGTVLYVGYHVQSIDDLEIVLAFKNDFIRLYAFSIHGERLAEFHLKGLGFDERILDSQDPLPKKLSEAGIDVLQKPFNFDTLPLLADHLLKNGLRPLKG